LSITIVNKTWHGFAVRRSHPRTEQRTQGRVPARPALKKIADFLKIFNSLSDSMLAFGRPGRRPAESPNPRPNHARFREFGTFRNSYAYMD
jgi:hypothetical protein